MARRSLCMLLVAARAYADPVACTIGPDHISGDASHLLVCEDATACIAFASPNVAPARVEVPLPAPPSMPAPVFRTDAKNQPEVCGLTCKPAGLKLAAAARMGGNVAVTPDAALAVIGGEAWDVAADAPVVIPKPIDRTPVLSVAGHVIVAAWRNCADDLNCGDAIATIIDARGKQIGKPFPDGRLVIVDDHHAMVVGDGRRLTAFDTDTGAQLGTIALIPNVPITGLDVGKVDDGKLGVAWKAVATEFWTIALVQLGGDKPPKVAWTTKLAVCAP